MSTPTEPHHDMHERAARALYEHRQAAEAAPQDGYTTWDDLPEDWQDEYREAADAVLAAVSAAVPMTTTPPPEGTTEPRCEHTEHATRGDGRYGRHFEIADPAGAWEPCPSPPVSAAAPDERAIRAEAVREVARWIERLHPRGLTNRATILADLDIWADRMARGLRANGNPYEPPALAARPAPVASGKARTPDESCISGAAEHAGAAADEGGQER